MASGDSNRHEALMRRAIHEARRAEGRTSPNPMVGCVLARDGDILSTGYHRGPGRRHAEVAALDELSDEAEGSDVFVNLEPCCHRGRTDPCTDALIDAGVARVFVGVEDPDPRVSGDGIRQLRDAGIEVVVGLLEAEARRLNRAYFRYMNEGRPWVSAKYAMTLDGKIATREGSSAWITGEPARRRVHELRDLYDAIMVGTGTFRSDDPRLTSRIPEGDDPIRVVLDAQLEGALESNLYGGGAEAPETVAVVAEAAATDSAGGGKIEVLRDRGVDILRVPTDDAGRLVLEELLSALAERDIVRLLVEGGGGVIGSLFDGGLIDRVYAFVAPKLVGGADAPTPNDGRGIDAMEEAVPLEDPTLEPLGSDWLVWGDLRRDASEARGTNSYGTVREA